MTLEAAPGTSFGSVVGTGVELSARDAISVVLMDWYSRATGCAGVNNRDEDARLGSRCGSAAVSRAPELMREGKAKAKLPCGNDYLPPTVLLLRSPLSCELSTFTSLEES